MIDPQNDFCIANGPGGEKGQLVVGGADADMDRLAKFITKNKKRFEEIHCTLDSHQLMHIAHPNFWRDSKGNMPPAYTIITADDVKKGTWRPFRPDLQAKAQAYVDTLAKNGRYQLCIWPPHCLIGSWGAAVVPSVHAALVDWMAEKCNTVNFVAKGSNPFTEHYSGVQADVPDDQDPSTKLNTNLIDALTDADEIVITGEALSHCVANTVTDVATQFGPDNIKKFTLLTDTTSPVGIPVFVEMGKKFVMDMAAKGMRVTTTANW